MDINDDENIEWLMESSKTVENSGESNNFELIERESRELTHFLQVLRSAFENEPVVFDLKAKGIVRNDEDLQKLLKRLKALGYFFSIRSSDKKSYKQNHKLMIANKITQSSSHPFRVINHIHYSCSHRNKEKCESNDIGALKQCRKYPTCKASMDIRQVEIFTNVCLAPARRKRVEMLKKFRRNLSTNAFEPGVRKYSVIISLPKVHNHFRSAKGQYLSDEVKAAMHSILKSGVTSLSEIQEKLYQIVDEDFINDSVKPSRDNSAFYPNQKTIYNHLRHDGLVLKRIYKKNASEIVELKKKVYNEFKFIYSDIKNCTNYHKLVKIYNTLKILGNECKINAFINSE